MRGVEACETLLAALNGELSILGVVRWDTLHVVKVVNGWTTCVDIDAEKESDSIELSWAYDLIYLDENNVE